jgi:hypothetical protein
METIAAVLAFFAEAAIGLFEFVASFSIAAYRPNDDDA